ncbi:TetR/AcrR family transcriptional regulator [Schaalia sp.]|uniref:TetR/AcrR family transcriptional regulator n=1 Tax=Schaalia sp. TaxID=2691890 RepID=UPI003D106BE7
MSNIAGRRLDADQRRAQIIKVANEHFTKLGITGVSMSAVAKDAGVTRALIYHYFPGKNALLHAVLTDEAERLLDATAPDPELSPRANLNKALGAYLDFFAASSGGIRELYAPASALPIANELAEKNHARHIDWILDATAAPDNERSRLTIGAWLAFVEFIARESTGAPTPRTALIDLCIATLEGALGSSLATCTTSTTPEKDTE